MKLENEFTVPASVDEAWNFLLDVPRVAPCLPGATVDPETDEDGAYKGTMKIKIGPITAQYKGTVRIQSSDEANHTVAMRATAKDTRGQGSASATITSTMEETAEGTKVSVITDMRVTGPAAQFGRGVMQDVSAKLMTRFAECLADQLSAQQEAPAATADGAAAEAVPTTWSDAAGTEAEAALRVSSGVSSAEAEPELVPSAEAEPEAALSVEPEAMTPSAEPEAALSAEPEPTTPSAEPEATAPSAEPEVAPSAEPEATASTPEPPKPAAAAPRPTDDVLDLGEAAGGAVLKRVLPLIGVALGVLVLLRILRR